MSKENQETVSVITSNTLHGAAIQAETGLEIVKNDDLLTHQEVGALSEDYLSEALGSKGFDLVHRVGAFGLSIAVRRDSHVKLVEGSQRTHLLQPLSLTEKFLVSRDLKGA